MKASFSTISVNRLFLLLSLFHSFCVVKSFPFSNFLNTRREVLETAASSSAAVITGTSSSSIMNSSASSSNNNSNDKTTTNTSTIRWGIVGLGDVVQKKSGPPFWKCDGSELVAVMRRTPNKAAEFASTKVPGGNCVGYESLDDFLNHPDGMDAVYVATRPGTHLEICKAVAKAGLACYVEKPVGRCAQETIEIQQIFEDAGLPLYTAYISRAYDRTQAIRTLLQQGAIGDRLNRVNYKLVGTGGARDMDTKDLPWRLDVSQSGGGLIMDVGCHVIDRLDYICGTLVKVQGGALNRNSPKQDVEDFVHFTATIGTSTWGAMQPSTAKMEGAIVKCTWDFAGKEACDELTFLGPEGSLRMAGMSPNGPIEVLDLDGNIKQNLEFDMPEHTAQQLIQAVTNDLLRRRQQNKDDINDTETTATGELVDFLSFGENAIRAQKILDTCLSPYYGTREIGYWEKPSETWPGKKSSSSSV